MHCTERNSLCSVRPQNQPYQRTVPFSYNISQPHLQREEVGFEIWTENPTADYGSGNPVENRDSDLKQEQSLELSLGASSTVLLRYQPALKSIPRFIDLGRKYQLTGEPSRYQPQWVISFNGDRKKIPI